MPAPFNTISGANLFAGDDPDTSYHLSLDTVGLPSLNQRMAEHAAGGSKMAIEIPMEQLDPLTIPFKLMGFDEGMLRRAGLSTNGRLQTYTIFKEIRDNVNGGKQRLTGVAAGFLASTEQDGYRKPDLSGFDYQIMGVRRWKLTLGNRVIHDFDWAAGRFIVGDDNLDAETSQILGIA